MNAPAERDDAALRTHEADIERRAAALGAGRTPSRTQQVYAALRDEIIRTRLAPGSLVLEPELAARFGVSKTPVREALQVLAAEGLVQTIPRRGYVVSPLDINDVLEVFDLRAMIEPPVTAAATRLAPDGLADELQRRLDIQRAGIGTSALTDAARSFHECIIDASRNTRARAVMSTLFDETTRGHHTSPALDARLHSELENDGHQLVLDAIESGDPDAAADAMRQHLVDLRSFVLQSYLSSS